MKKTLLFLLLFPFVALALEGTDALALLGTGSVDFDEVIMPLLNENVVLKEFVLCNFDIVSDPMGIRIGDVQSKALGGGRFGPYGMWANWHGNSGVKPVVLTINTSTKFLDAQGKEDPNGELKNAVRIEEHLAGVTVEPAEEGQMESVPGGLVYKIDSKMCSAKPGL